MLIFPLRKYKLISDKHYYTVWYRIIDLSSIDEVAQRWNGKVYKKKDLANTDVERINRAEPNVLRAIKRLEYYKENLFKVKDRGQSSGKKVLGTRHQPTSAQKKSAGYINPYKYVKPKNPWCYL